MFIQKDYLQRFGGIWGGHNKQYGKPRPTAEELLLALVPLGPGQKVFIRTWRRGSIIWEAHLEWWQSFSVSLTLGIKFELFFTYQTLGSLSPSIRHLYLACLSQITAVTLTPISSRNRPNPFWSNGFCIGKFTCLECLSLFVLHWVSSLH